jgi:hypothetical protein
MSADVTLRCRCGEVRGRVRGVSSHVGNRCVCYCNDCQAFGHFIGAGDVLDAQGGTDIYQISPARVEIEQGQDKIACIHLRDGGLFRWYASCCRTAIGNTLKPSLPFVGLIHTFTDHESDGRSRTEALGPVRGTNVPEAAKGEPLPSTRLAALAMFWRIGVMILGARLRGEQNQHPFFKAGTAEPITTPRVLTADQLAELVAARDA